MTRFCDEKSQGTFCASDPPDILGFFGIFDKTSSETGSQTNHTFFFLTNNPAKSADGPDGAG